MHENKTVNYWRGHINGLIIDQYADKIKGSVADFGSGGGYMSAIISELAGVKTVIAFDIVEPQIKLPSNVAFVEKDITKLTVPKVKFDSAISFHTLEHIKDVGTAIKKMHGQLKVGGYLIVSVPFMGAYWNETHLHQFNIDTLRNLMETGTMIKEKKPTLFKTVELYHDTRIDNYGDKHDCITGLFRK